MCVSFGRTLVLPGFHTTNGPSTVVEVSFSQFSMPAHVVFVCASGTDIRGQPRSIGSVEGEGWEGSVLRM